MWISSSSGWRVSAITSGIGDQQKRRCHRHFRDSAFRQSLNTSEQQSLSLSRATGQPAPQETEPINYNPLPRGLMANLAGLVGFVSELKTVRTSLVNQLRHVDAALSVLGKLKGGRNSTKPRHTLSASARKRMSLAQRARWAKAKGRAPRPKRSMSASARRKIAAAQRARWATIRAAKK